MKNRTGFGWTLGVLVLVGAKNLQAAPERFGDKGQIVIDQRFNVRGVHAFSNDEVPFSATGLTLAPAASYFVTPKLSVGLHTLLGYNTTHYTDSDTRQKQTMFAIGPSLGYAVPLTEHVSLWPQLEATYFHGWWSSPGAVGPDTSSGISASVGLPVLWSPAEHFFVGVGPNVDWFSGWLENGAFTGDRVLVGLTTSIGGYFAP